MRFNILAIFALVGVSMAANEGFVEVVRRQRPTVDSPSMAGADGVVKPFNAALVE